MLSPLSPLGIIAGYVKDIDALGIATLCHRLGCGRTCPGSPVKFEPGVILLKKPGERVAEKEVLLQVHLPNDYSDNPVLWSEDQVLDMFTFHPDEPAPKPLVVKML